MKNKIEHAFILAAGFGKRLRPYTDTIPKPMVPMGGRPIIDQVIDRLEDAGVKDVTINLHYRGDVLESHLSTRRTPRLVFSRERDLLDTGGGIRQALHTLGDEAFFVVSGDSLWTDGPADSALERLQDGWKPDEMDILILLYPVDKMTLTPGVGDYDVLPGGRAVRSRDRTGTHMWTSMRVCHPRLFDETPDGAFSFLDLLDRAEAQGRLFALVHDGDWYHVSTPEDLDRINAHIAGQTAAERRA